MPGISAILKNMIGSLKHVGISMTYEHGAKSSYGWAATAHFVDSGFCNDTDTEISVQGQLSTRYVVGNGNIPAAEKAFNTLITDLDSMGIDVVSDEFKYIHVTNSEDEELGKQGTIRACDIPDAEKERVFQVAEANGYRVIGLQISV